MKKHFFILSLFSLLYLTFEVAAAMSTTILPSSSMTTFFCENERKKQVRALANATKTNAAHENALSAANVKELNLNSRLTQLAKFHLIYT
jgi:hypothetical protein